MMELLLPAKEKPFLRPSATLCHYYNRAGVGQESCSWNWTARTRLPLQLDVNSGDLLEVLTKPFDHSVGFIDEKD